MSEHTLFASGKRTVDVKLTVGEDGIENEVVTNVGSPSPTTETYECTCGAHFNEFADAKDHILEVA